MKYTLQSHSPSTLSVHCVTVGTICLASAVMFSHKAMLPCSLCPPFPYQSFMNFYTSSSGMSKMLLLYYFSMFHMQCGTNQSSIV